jgi:hypothetical protein
MPLADRRAIAAAVEALVGNRELFCRSSNDRQSLLRGEGEHLGRAVDHDRLPILIL